MRNPINRNHSNSILFITWNPNKTCVGRLVRKQRTPLGRYQRCCAKFWPPIIFPFFKAHTWLTSGEGRNASDINTSTIVMMIGNIIKVPLPAFQRDASMSSIATTSLLITIKENNNLSVEYIKYYKQKYTKKGYCKKDTISQLLQFFQLFSGWRK